MKFKGKGNYGTVLATVAGNKAHKGNSKFSKIIATGERCTEDQISAAAYFILK